MPSKGTEQISYRGNLFVPTRDQLMLYKSGWQLAERRKNGMIWIVRWLDPKTGEVWPQGTAAIIQKKRKANPGKSYREE